MLRGARFGVVSLLTFPFLVARTAISCVKRGSKSIADAAAEAVHELQDDIIKRMSSDALEQKISEMRARIETGKYRSKRKVKAEEAPVSPVAPIVPEPSAQQKSIKEIEAWTGASTTIVAVRCVGLEIEHLGKNYLEKLLSSDGETSISGLIATARSFTANSGTTSGALGAQQALKIGISTKSTILVLTAGEYVKQWW